MKIEGVQIKWDGGRMKKVLFFLLPVFLMNSCALLFNGTRQNVSVKSMTEGSKIYIDGDFVGKDMVSVKLKRGDNHNVVIKKEGYKTKIVGINSRVQAGWIVFDVLFNWLAFFTDPTTGAWCELDKDNIVVELQNQKGQKNSK
jgi:hypothetical protein